MDQEGLSGGSKGLNTGIKFREMMSDTGETGRYGAETGRVPILQRIE